MQLLLCTIALITSVVASRAGTPLVLLERTQPLPAIAARGVALADFNGDGHVDAFVTADDTPDSRGHRVYLGDGAGHFADSGQVLASALPWTHRPAVADIDGDGDLDAVASRIVWLNDGQGRFTGQTDRIGGERPDLTAVGLADLDGNGTPDLFAIERWKTVRVYVNDGHGMFRDTGQRLDLGGAGSTATLGTFALGDLDGDGTIDAVTVGWRNQPSDPCPNRLWRNDGHGRFHLAPAGLDEGLHHVHGVALGDLDGDRKLDLVLALTAKGEAGKVYLNSGGGQFRDTGQKLGDSWAHAVALGDLNGDGTLDLVLACGDPKRGTPNQVWLNDGHGCFTDTGLRLGHAFSWDVALADLDHNGRPDLFVANLRLADPTKTPPVFGGAAPEIWLNLAVK